MRRLKSPTASERHRAEAFPMAAVSSDRRGLGASSEELAQLDRELDAYLAFWAYAREGRSDRPWERERE